MTSLLIQSFLRSKALMLGLLLLFFSGLLSLYIGKIFLEQKATTEVKTAQFQEEHLQRHLASIDGDIGLLLYYIRFGLVNETPNLAGLAIGHRDIHSTVQSVNIRNLEEQKYSSELMNPLYQLLGNMDFSFILIYFFPLMIIAFCFNLLSEEKEGGTWTLILSQSSHPLKVIRAKLWIRFVSIFSVLCLILLIAQWYLSIPFDAAFALFVLTAVCYLLFWFALTWWVISLQKPSAQNALILLLTWVSLTLVVPASVSALVVNLYPVPEAYSTIVESRDGYHSKWDQPKAPTIKKFKAHYPQFIKYEHPVDQSFSWFWYFAMQQMGDDEAAQANRAMKNKLQQRDRFSRNIGYVFPTMHTQFSLNTLSRSDMANYLDFITQLEAFHEAKRLHFYPQIFENTPIADENWDAFGLEYFKEDSAADGLRSLSPLVLGGLLFLFGARRNWSLDPTMV
ncbi:MAG: DUF3526 domain-containing protein [Bacteroidota bacterium]